MATVVLLRHGLTASTGPVLSGRSPGLHLDDRGTAQAAVAAGRLGAVRLAAIVTSPMERCVETAERVLAAQREAGYDPAWHVDERLVECDYGGWTGRALKDLARDPLWKLVQGQPSAVRFPDGESLVEVHARAVAAVRDWDARLGENAVWVACSHGDVIKTVVADALGLHLDQFQRITVDPCSVSAIRYTPSRPYLLRANDSGPELSYLAPPRRRSRRRGSDDAAVGGGAGGGTV